MASLIEPGVGPAGVSLLGESLFIHVVCEHCERTVVRTLRVIGWWFALHVNQKGVRGFGNEAG